MIETADPLGLRLRRQREAIGLSQRQLARRAGVSAAYISLIEQGRRRPEAPVRERLRQALADGCTAAPASNSAASQEPVIVPRVDGLSGLAVLLDSAGLPPDQRALIESLIHAYAAGLIARAREGRPLVTDLAAPWQARVLEALQEKMTEDFEQFRDAYLNRLDEL